MAVAKLKVASVIAAMLAVAAGTGLGVAKPMEAGAPEAKAGPPNKTPAAKLATLRIESTPSGAKVFIRTGGHNGYAEVGKTPITLRDVEPGLLEYTLLRNDCRLYDGSLWIEPGKEHVEKVAMEPGRVFFVDGKNPRASDANPGTEAAPWQTPRRACEAIRPGDTVLFRAGRYVDPWKPGWSNKYPFTPDKSGTAQAPIVLRAYPGEMVILGLGRRPNTAVRIYCRKYVVIDGFKVEGRVAFTSERGRPCEGCVVRNCDVSVGYAPPGDPSLNWGIVNHAEGRVRIANNYVHDILDSGNHGHNTACIMLFSPSSGCIVENNEADTGPERLIYNAFGQKGGHIFGNIWRRNIARNAAAGFLGMAATACDESSGDNVYYCNLCINCKTAFELNHMCYGFRIFNNTAWNCYRFLSGGDGCERNRCWNNIAVVKIGYSTGRWPVERLFVFCDYNLLWVKKVARHRWRPYADDLAAWRAKTGFGGHSVAADPLFVDPGRGDFRLRRGSPAVHAGRPLAAAVGSGRDSNLLEITNQGSYVYVVQLHRGRHGAAPPEDRPLRSPFEPGDFVQIGLGERARVAEVIDRTHLKLDRKVSWKDGDWVTFPFKGKAPDIGAYEYGDERQIIGPTWKHYPKRDFSKKKIRSAAGW